jgi:SAM-dependent methyltransferase
MSLQREEWDEAYKKGDNFVFYPHEEIIRFVSKHIRKRRNFDEFKVVFRSPVPARILDVGCGIGRHVKFLDEYQLDAYGIDLSPHAIAEAVRLFELQGLSHLKEKIGVASVDDIDFGDGFFDFVISHGVFDSMHFDIAQAGMKEMHRILKPEGMMYLDLISGGDSRHEPGFDGEEIVQTDHEEGTIQSYFSVEKIEQMMGNSFAIVELDLIEKTAVKSGRHHSRFHVVVKKF